MAFKEFSGELDATPGLKEFSGELDKPDEGGYQKAVKAIFSKIVPNGNDLRDLAAATLKIGPTALKGVGDITQLVTGGKYGSGVSNAMTEGMQAIDSVIGTPELAAQKANVNAALNDPNKGIADLASTVIDNPRAAVDAGVSTIGSMFVPAGAAKAVTLIPRLANPGRAATAAAVGSNAAMNAADTFTSVESPDLTDKYTGAGISGLASLGVGALTGGGAEGLIAKKIANDPSLRQTATNVFARLFGQPLKTMGKEGLQEAGEASGNYLGEIAGDGKEFNVNQLGKRAAYEGALGAILGGSVGAATNSAGNPPNVTIVGNPAPVPQMANPNAAADLSSLIAGTATMPSKLAPAPDDIKLDAAPQAPVVSTEALEVTPQAPEVSDEKIIQNRNRATPSSIAQMTAISAAPDYNRLSFSRDFANGAPVVSGGFIPDTQLGSVDVAVASDGRRIPIQYAVVDAGELLASNQADGTENAAFYDGNVDAVRAIAGNGRIAGLQSAYGKDTAADYRAELEADKLHGIDQTVIAGMANPVLVRVMPQEHVTADIGDVSNTVGNLELSPVEQANNDVQRVNLEALSFSDDGSVTPQAVRQFVQAMPQAEQGSLLDTNGQPTKQAVDRLNAAIFAKAYGKDELIRLYAQAQDGEARVVLSALAQVAPKMARLEGAGQLDIRQAVTDAADIAVNARRNGLSITRAAQQVDITADPNVVEVLTLFAANVRSSKAIAEALGRAADFAYSEAIKPAEDMFGEVPKASRQEVFNQLGNQDEPTSTQDLPDAQGAGGVSQDPQRAAVLAGGQGDANRAGEGRPVNDTAARQDAPDYGLDSYTNRDIVERLDRIEKAQKEAADRAKADEAKRQADLDRETFGLTGSESPTDRLEAQGQGRLFQEAHGYGNNLVITHNLTAANLLHAVKMGGIPVPSLAVTKKDAALTNFGEITLIGSKEMADPKGYAGTKVFGADIYSPRYPTVSYEFTPNMRKRTEAMLKDGMDATGTRYIEWSEVEKEGAREFERSNPFLWKFLIEHGIDPKIVRSDVTPLPTALMRFADDKRFAHELSADPDFIAAAWQAHEDVYTQAYDGDREAAKADIADIKEKGERRGVSFVVNGYARDIEQYQRQMRDAGKIDSNATRYAMGQQVREAGLAHDLESAAKSFIREIKPNERIFQGFTPSGNRRYIPHTLENVVKILKKELRGGENFNYGVGSIRAKFTPQFRSIEQIRKSKDKLLDKSGFDAAKEEIDSEFMALGQSLAEYHGNGNAFGFLGDTMTQTLYDAASMGVPKALQENGFNDVPAEKQEAIAEFLSKLRTLPTEYFEAKILRDVDLAEFSGAVVPEGVDPQVIEALQARGVKDIATYPKNDEAARRAAIETLSDELQAAGRNTVFQGSPAYNSQYGRQIDFFLDYGSDASQDSAAGDAAKRQAVSAVDDLRSSGSVLGKALSSDYATGQRTTLVGREAKTAEDLATLAQVYRDPRFETFRVIFVNDAGRVLSQVGLTSRLPTSTEAIMGDDVDAYLSELSSVASKRGATGYWMLHNHPSGHATPSSADVRITQLFGERMPGLTNKGHVVIDTNEYATISDKPIYREVGNEQDPNKSYYRITKKDFGAVQPMTAGEFSLQRINGAEDAMRMAKQLDVDHGSVTIIGLDAQMRVQRISAVPSSVFSDNHAANRLVLLKESLSNKTFRIILVGRDRTVLENAGQSATDAIHIANDGTVRSLSNSGQAGWKELYPSQRRARVSPDTSPEFDYLRNVPTAKQLAAVREEESDFGPVLTQYRGDAPGAIQKLIELQTGDAVGALTHPEIGSIDLIYGKEGEQKYSYRDGFGLGKIAIKHPEVLSDLQNIIAGMRITVRSDNRINLESATHKGAVRLEWNGQRKTWLLTAFEKVADGANTRTDTIGLNGEGDTARSAAAASDIVANNADKANLRQMPPEYDSPQQEMNAPETKLVFDPLKRSDFWSTVQGESGRKQYAAGRKLWDMAAGYAEEYLGKLKLADTKPGVFKEMMRQFNVDKTKASQQAKRIAETGMSLTAEQRELISDMIEKQVKVGDMVPEDVAKLATTMTAALDVQARDLVDLGMLSEDRLVKNYLPRLYKSGLSGMLTNPTLMRSWFTKARMRIRGDRLMSRGMFEEIDANKVEQAKRLGWKVSSMPGGDPVPGELLAAIDSGSDIPGQYRSAKVMMWRDYTESERQQMGEIRDGVLRYALGYVETQKDIAIGRLFKAIANNSDLAKAYNPGGWVKVPDHEIKGAPGTKAYGALSGMWVEPQVADSLKRNTQPKGVLMAAYDKALSFWKEGKTVWNPVSHGNNVVSNLFTIYFAGINPANPKPWRETLREYRTKGEYYTEALDNGLFGNEWANKEIQDLLMPDFADMADMETVAASRVAKMVEFAKKAGKPVSWYRENMQKAYEFEDQFFKLMLYIDRRKAGMEPHAAITDAERYVFNYADMPEGVELIKRTLSPFFAYTYKAIPMVLHTAMTRPDRMLAPIMLLGGANWLAYMLLGADEEEERKGMPEYMKGRTAIGTQKSVRMPFNIGGQPAFLDMSRRVPLGDLFDINNQTNGMPLPAPFMPSHPVLTMMQAVLYNQDTFTGRDLVKASDTGWEAAKARSGYMIRQFAPNAPFVPGSYNFNKLADATANMFDTEIGPYTGRTKSGDPIRMATVLPDVLTGTKIRTVDPQRGMAYQNAALDKEAQEIRANIRAAGRNKSMTDKSRQAYIDEQTEKLRMLGERRVELNQ